MNDTILKETFYRLAKEELDSKGIDDPKAIEELIQKYYDEIKSVRENNIKDDRAKKFEKVADLE